MLTDRNTLISRLWHSLEMKTIKRDVIAIACLLGIPCLLAAASGEPVAVSFGLFLIPFLGFYLWRTIGIFHKPGHYIFCKCLLDQPHSNTLAKSMYFTVRIDTPNGRTHMVDTHAIFTCHGIMEPRMEDYVNSTATIAYNPETEMVVVIG